MEQVQPSAEQLEEKWLEYQRVSAFVLKRQCVCVRVYGKIWKTIITTPWKNMVFQFCC